MSKCYVSYNNIISNLGFDSETVVKNISKEVSGLQFFDNTSLLPVPFYAAVVSCQPADTASEKIEV